MFAGANTANTQIINGQSYEMYSPAWYQAMHDEAQRAEKAKGTASGASLKAAADAAGVPLGPSTSSSSTTSSKSGSSASAGGGVPPTVMPPSLAGLSSAAGVSGAPGGSPSGGGGNAHLAPVDTSAAEAASFNRAKDQVGQEATGSLTGLRSALAGRGLLGGGLEERGTASVVNNAAGQLGDVSRQQAITRADQARQEATANLGADVAQRGQDFQREEAANSLAGSMAMGTFQGQIAERGQDIQAANAAKALEIEQAQLASQQRSTALAGLESALKVTSPSDLIY